MQTETQCPASARYLFADELYTDAALKTMQADCARQYQKRAKDVAYATFVQWTRLPNEVVVYTWNAYADLLLPKQFDCIFHLDNPSEHLLINYVLIQAILDLGGLHPLNRVEHGHKHVCVFRFAQQVPAVFQLLPQPFLPGAFKLGFCQAADLPAITAEHERIAQLRAQYGAHWWEHDELSN